VANEGGVSEGMVVFDHVHARVCDPESVRVEVEVEVEVHGGWRKAWLLWDCSLLEARFSMLDVHHSSLYPIHAPPPTS